MRALGDTLTCWWNTTIAYLDAHTGAISGVGTAIIAIFTIALALSTRRLWKEAKVARGISQTSASAAKAAAEAATQAAITAVAVEVPMIFVTKIEVERRPSVLPVTNREYLPVDAARIKVAFENFGRTPALITELCIEWWFGDLAPEPPYQIIRPMDTGTILKPGEHFVYPTEDFDVDFTERQILETNAERLIFWVYGYIAYSDFLDGHHRVGFCGRWLKGNNRAGQYDRFVEGGPPNYVYRQ